MRVCKRVNWGEQGLRGITGVACTTAVCATARRCHGPDHFIESACSYGNISGLVSARKAARVHSACIPRPVLAPLSTQSALRCRQTECNSAVCTQHERTVARAAVVQDMSELFPFVFAQMHSLADQHLRASISDSALLQTTAKDYKLL